MTKRLCADRAGQNEQENPLSRNSYEAVCTFITRTILPNEYVKNGRSFLCIRTHLAANFLIF